VEHCHHISEQANQIARLEDERMQLLTSNASKDEDLQTASDTATRLQTTEECLEKMASTVQEMRLEMAVQVRQMEESRLNMTRLEQESERHRLDAMSFRAQLSSANSSLDRARQEINDAMVHRDQATKLRGELERISKALIESTKNFETTRAELICCKDELERTQRNVDNNHTRATSYKKLLGATLEQLNASAASRDSLTTTVAAESSFRQRLTNYVDDLERSVRGSQSQTQAATPSPVSASSSPVPVGRPQRAQPAVSPSTSFDSRAVSFSVASTPKFTQHPKPAPSTPDMQLDESPVLSARKSAPTKVPSTNVPAPRPFPPKSVR